MKTAVELAVPATMGMFSFTYEVIELWMAALVSSVPIALDKTLAWVSGQLASGAEFPTFSQFSEEFYKFARLV